MALGANLNQDLIRRARASRVSRRICFPFVRLVQKWNKNSGTEWTVNRVKAIKLDLIRKRAGLLPVSCWIAKSNSRTIFTGLVGALENWMFSHPDHFSKGIQLLQIYTSFYSSGVTPQQLSKFMSAVQSAKPLSLDHANRYLRKGIRLAGLRKMKGSLPVCKPLETCQVSSMRRAPTPLGSFPEDKALIDSLGYLIFSQAGKNHLRKYWSLYEPLLENLIPMLGNKISGQSSPYSDNSKDLCVGRIGLIQEPGYKLRAVANPGRVFQEVLRPLGDRIYSLLSHLPWDCTFDQSKAIPYIQDALQHGCEVSSIDLSNATDYFPLDLQIQTLNFLFPDALDVNLFNEISQSRWYLPVIRDDIRWNRGQPLGLYPSFASFALTHGLLLLGLLNRPFNGQFFILGDDVVILDSQLAQDYQNLLQEIGCPVSLPKCLFSNSLAEFAGKIISSVEVISQLKWRGISDESFIDLSRNIGRAIYPLLRPRQRRVIDEIKDVPEFLGGLGWNTSGLPLESRIKSWVFSEKADSPRLMGYHRVILKNLYSSRILHGAVEEKDFVFQYYSALDQRATQLVRDRLGETLVPLTSILGTNIDRVFRDSQQVSDLPIEGVEKTYLSSLMRMERRLGLSRMMASHT